MSIRIRCRRCFEDLQVDTPAGHHGRRTAMFDLRKNDDQNALIGCGLGTSLINANVALKAEDRVFDDPCWPRALRDDPGGLEQGYARLWRCSAPKPYPETSPPLPKLQTLEEQPRGVEDARFYHPPINVTFRTVSMPPVSSRERARCAVTASRAVTTARRTRP